MDEDTKNNKRYCKIGIRAGIIILLLWISSYFIMNCLFFTKAEGGSVGDQFGAVNALFSGLAFMGLIVTMIMQRDELRLQRRALKLQRVEMKATTTELAGQKAQFELQNATLKKQQFESTFFQLLNQLNSQYLKNSTSTLSDYVVALSHLKSTLLYKSKPARSPIQSGVAEDDFSIKNMKRKIDETKFFENNSFVGLYCRSLYRLIKYVDDRKDLTDIEKYQYTTFARTQLSDEFLELLFFNCTISYGKDNFKPLLIKWVLLDNISHNSFAYKKCRSWIHKHAFERDGRYE